MGHVFTPSEAAALKAAIRDWGRELGFAAIGFAGTDLGEAEARLLAWLAAGHHGAMDYMARHGAKRARPTELVPGTVTIITARMDYLPPAHAAEAILADPMRAYIARYALGRDYHKRLRQSLQQLAERIAAEIGPFGYRAFADSAPVLEVELAARSGLGWRGKHTLTLAPHAGSWFFLGELFTTLALPPDPAVANHCGTCQACLTACPTQAILAPYVLDARRCIAYLTIEHPGPIPEALRPLLGNRIFGCDDCQLVCPWNRFAKVTTQPDFLPREGLDRATLIELFAWSEAEFEKRLAGSPIRRIGHARWLRNIAVAMGNAPADAAIQRALASRRDHPSGLVREHVAWALARQRAKLAENA